ncbi:hypothetical protein [Thauera humireducens]|uniref:hypothetical protein n=1 Tax=Thauera humireducens TaxID=1134435 RepID=UPI0024A9458F|nr:hypothetical protein [Thauera humireducens]
MQFDALLGVASQGNDVHSNAVFAGRVYYLMTREGRTLGQAVEALSGTLGNQTIAIETNYAKLEHLRDRNGYDRMRGSFNTKATVGELNAICARTILRSDSEKRTPRAALPAHITPWKPGPSCKTVKTACFARRIKPLPRVILGQACCPKTATRDAENAGGQLTLCAGFNQCKGPDR